MQVPSRSEQLEHENISGIALKEPVKGNHHSSEFQAVVMAIYLFGMGDYSLNHEL